MHQQITCTSAPGFETENKRCEILDCAFSANSDGLSIADMADDTQMSMEEMVILKEKSRMLHEKIGKISLQKQFIIKSIYFDDMKQAGVEFVLVDYWKRYPPKAFDKWHRSQNRYRNAEDREKVRDILESSMAMPEMARLLGVPRSTVYGILNQSEILKTIEFDGRRRVTKKSFYEWYGSQDDYHIVSDEIPETVKGEDNRRIEAYRRAVLERDGHSKNIGNDVYLTVNEAAVLAGVNPATVHKWIKKGKVEAVQSSKTIRIPRQEFEGWLQGREKEFDCYMW